MAASITTALKMDDTDLKAKLSSITKYYQKAYGQWADETAKLNSANAKLDMNQKRLRESVINLKTETEKGSKVNKKAIAIAREKVKVQALAVRLDKMEVGSIKAKMSAQSAEMAQMKTATTVLKENENAQKSANATRDKSTKSTGNLANATIRYLRWAGTMVGVAYAANRAWRATLGVGIEVNKMMEDNTSGIAALLSANTQMVLSNGQVVNSYEKFKLGQEVATQTMEDLRKASVKTYATFPQLTEIFQQAIGQTMSMGHAFGTTVDQITSNTIKLSQRMSNIAGAIGMPMDRAKEEIRSLLSGNASTDSLISTMIFGSPGEANKAIRMAKARGTDGLTDLLDSVLAPFDALENVDSYTRSLLELEDAWSQLWQTASEPLFESLKHTFKDLATDINESKKALIEFNAHVNTINDIKEDSGVGVWTIQLKQVREELKNLENDSWAFIKNERSRAQEIANRKWQILEIEEKIAKAESRKTPDLQTKPAFDSKFLEASQKAINKDKKETLKLAEHIAKAESEIVLHQQSIKTNQEAYAKDYATKKILNSQVLASENAISTLKKVIIVDTKKIAEIEQKALDKASRARAKQFNELAKAQNKRYKNQLASDAALRKEFVLEGEINRLLAIRGDWTLDEVSHSQSKLEILAREYTQTEDTLEKKKLLKEIVKEQINEETEGRRLHLELEQEIYDRKIETLDIQLELASSTKNWQDGLTGVAKSVGGVSSSFSKMHVNNLNYEKAQAKLEKQKAKEQGKFTKTQIGYHSAERKFEGDSAKLKEQNTQNQISAYADLAGASAGMFEENSAAAKTALIAQQVLATAVGVTAILSAGKTATGYETLPMMAAAATVVTGLLASANIAFSGGGSSGGGMTATEVEAELQGASDGLALGKFDRMIELLDSIDKAGSAGVFKIERSTKQFNIDMYKLSADIATSFRHSISGGSVYQSAQQFDASGQRQQATEAIGFDVLSGGQGHYQVEASGVLGDTEKTLNFLKYFSENPEQARAIMNNTVDKYILQWLNEAQDYIQEYAITMGDVISEMSDASDSFRDLYDNITGTTRYADERLTQAFADFDSIRGNESYAEYLEKQIDAITEVEKHFGLTVEELLLSTDPDLMMDQIAAINELSAATNMAFEGGVKDALNYIESIELVSESMVTSLDGVRALSESFVDLGESIEDTIATLLGAQTGGDAQAQLIDTFWKKREELDVLLAKDGDLTTTQQESMEDLVGDINSLSQNIQSANVGDNQTITQNLVSELTGLKDELDFDNQILNVRIVEFVGGIGGTAEAEVGVLSALPSYDIGTNYVPYDQVAQIHRGERILTASENRDFSFSRPVNNQSFNKEVLLELKQMSARLHGIELASEATKTILDESQNGQRTLKVEATNTVKTETA